MMLHKEAVEYFFSVPFSHPCDRDGIEKGKYDAEGYAFFFIYDRLRTYYGVHAGFFPMKDGYQFTGYLLSEENEVPTPILTAEGETRFAGIVRLLQKCIERTAK